MRQLYTTLFLLFTGLLVAQTTTVWNPAANAGSQGLWTTAANWTTAAVPDADSKVVFNVPGAQNARLNASSTIFQFVLGDGARGEALFVQDGGTLNTSANIWSAIGWSDTSRLVVETGGTVNLGLHMWVGWLPGGLGIVEVNGGTLNVGAQTGLGWTDANKTTAGVGRVYVNNGLLKLSELHPSQSIGPESFIQIGGGTVTIQGDQQGTVNAYIAANKIRGIDGSPLDVVFADEVTTITAAATRAATTVWNPAGNPNSTGLWTEAENWSDGFVPNDNKVVFNVEGVQPAVVDDSVAMVRQFVLGDGGPGTLTVANGGMLSTSPEIWSAVGWTDTARLIVETGGTVSFGQHMWVGFEPNGLGVVELNGGTINVGAQTGLGWTDPNKTTTGVGQVYVNDGLLNLNTIHPTQSIGPESFIQVGGGTVVIQGDQLGAVNGYIAANKIRGLDGLTLDVSVENGVTSITAAASRAETTVWNPGGNPNATDLWTEAENWSDGFVPNGNKVVFNVDGAATAVLDDSVAMVRQFVLGDGGPGSLRIADGGMLTTSPEIWSAVGWTDTATLVVDTGGMVSFGQHMWVGFEPNGLGIVELNGGTINVGAQTGLGWTDPNKTTTGVGRVFVNSGTLNLTTIHPTQSIGPESFIQIGDGTVNIMGNLVAVTETYEAAGKITARDMDKTVVATFDTITGMTVLTAELSTSVGATVIPGRMDLQPNFPNPFRQSTTISYTLQERARVRLHVYNSNGQQVADLINQTQPIGDYQVEWDAGSLPAGIYVVRLTSDRFSLARQMTLVH